MLGKDDGTLTWGTKNVAMAEDVVPKSGTYDITGSDFFRNVNTSNILISGGHAWNSGAYLNLKGGASSGDPGVFTLHACKTDGTFKRLVGYPNGSLTWNGQSIQTTSDKRLKQQITQIDNDLLDAWQDVELVQFKYNDAVDQKGDNARLHTGYVVQQINEACQKHNINISAYGLYCHEEYPEMTEEVTIENEDGTTSKETRVVEPASEHYSLRYTETLVVECAYLRREINKLKEELNLLKTK